MKGILISEGQKDKKIELVLPINSFNKEEEELHLDNNTQYPPENYIDPSSQEDNIYLY